jgi:F0F1-type ATP synthase delta subunit
MKKYLVKVYRIVEQRLDVEVTSPVALTKEQILDFQAGLEVGEGVTISEEQHRPVYDSILREGYEIEEQA